MEKAKRGTREWALAIAARLWLDQEMETVVLDSGAAEAIAEIVLRVHDEQYPVQFAGYHKSNS